MISFDTVFYSLTIPTMDVTITNVPDGAEEKVKELAAVAVERFLRAKDLKVDEKAVAAFETKIDDFCLANEMCPKFRKEEIEPVDLKEASTIPSQTVL
jgi:hypothetical protein